METRRTHTFSRAPLAAGVLFLCAAAACRGGDAPDEPKKRPGPSHSVTLPEEERVYTLFEKAETWAARARQDPAAWTEATSCYAELLQNCADTVYLEHWEGPNQAEPAWRNGVYRTTLDRARRELAALPPAALDVYRAVYDGPAQAACKSAFEAGDETQVARVAWQWFGTAGGRDALFWLAEANYRRGALPLALRQYQLVAAYPGPGHPRAGAFVRAVMTQVRQGDRAGAEWTWRELDGLRREPGLGELRLGHAEGVLAMDDLWRLIEKLPVPPRTAPAPESGEPVLDTYYATPAHLAAFGRRIEVGAREWSVPLLPLFYGPAAKLSNLGFSMTVEDGPRIEMPRLCAQVTVRDGFFYLCNLWFGAAYPLAGPQPGTPENLGNGHFFEPPWPPSHPPALKEPEHWSGSEVNLSGEQHPYFVALGPEHAYLIASDRALENTGTALHDLNEKARPPAYLFAVRRPRKASADWAGEVVWALKPGEPCYQQLGAADQAFLQSVYWTSAPAFEKGVLYLVAADVQLGHSVFAAAVNAADGRLLWHTPLFTCSRQLLDGPVRPAQGLPPAVAGGAVYVQPNQGAVAALDAVDGSLRWIRVYERLNRELFRTPLGIWKPNPPILRGDRLYVTPQDSEYLYALDAQTGRTAWQMARRPEGEGPRDGGLQHVLGFCQDQLVVTGRRVHFVDAATGRPAVGSLDLGSPVKGRGVIAGDVLVIPTGQGLARIEARRSDGGFRAQVLDEVRWTEGVREAGDLFLGGGLLFSVSLSHVSAYRTRVPKD